MNQVSPFLEMAKRAVADVTAGDGFLLDVRSDDEWNAGHAPAALHWDIQRLEAGEMPDIPKDATVYVHCAAGGRAGKAKELLEAAGWQRVVNIGGLSDWESAGGASERS